MGTGGQKYAMLAKYNQSKQKCVLDWTVTMEEETEHVASTTRGSTESWMNNHEILKLISFDATALREDKAAQLLKDLLREAEVLPGDLAKFSSTTALCSRSGVTRSRTRMCGLSEMLSASARGKRSLVLEVPWTWSWCRMLALASRRKAVT